LQHAIVMTTHVANHGEKRLLALQTLRAIAATMIVFLHAEELVAIHAAAHQGSFSHLRVFPLGVGVDLFFVISGFVVAYASKSLFAAPGGRWEFMRRRLIRIVPLYWTALTLRLLALAVGFSLGTKIFPDAMAIATSYLFIPYDSRGFGPDYPFPVLDLGWTLNYEMFFYFLFACFIGLRRDVAVLAVVACLSTGIVLATLFPPTNLEIRFWLHPIALEFACGTLIALLFLRGLVLPRIVRLGLIVVAVCIWLVPVSWFGNDFGPGFYSWVRFMIWGVGAVLIVVAAALGPTSFKSVWSRTIADLGDSSYALYLMHPFVFLVVKAILSKVVVPEMLYWPLVIAISGLAIVSAALFHKLAEVPVITFLRKVTASRVVSHANI
jgi:exopolysaccharide production protein ExoZ